MSQTDLEFEGRLRSWYRQTVDDGSITPSQLRLDVEAISRTAQVVQGRARRRGGLMLLAAAGLVAVIGGGIAAGGLLSSPAPMVPIEVPSPAQVSSLRGPGTWIKTGSMQKFRDFGVTTTLLPDGNVLVAGGHGGDQEDVAPISAELYDSRSGQWTETAGMRSHHRGGHTMTLLRDGQVLVAGGSAYSTPGAGPEPQTSAELYDPSTGTWSETGSLTVARSSHIATLMPDGSVLVVGGWLQGDHRIAEVYDPIAGTWTQTTKMSVVRIARGATLLPDGTVLVIGGTDAAGRRLDAAEIYDPVDRTWTAVARPVRWDCRVLTVRLTDGRVLVVCAGVADGASSSAEVYDPTSGSWTSTGSPFRRLSGPAVLLADGRVLESDKGAGELYDPASGTWTTAGLPTYPGRGNGAQEFRMSGDEDGEWYEIDTATPLLDGRVLMTIGPDALLYEPATAP